MSELNASKAREIAGNPDPTCESYDLAEAKGFLTCHALAERSLVKTLEAIAQLHLGAASIKKMAREALSEWRKANGK